MKYKIDRLNKRLVVAIGSTISSLLPGQNITVRDVLVDDSLLKAKVWLDTTQELLKEVEHKRVDIQNSLGKFLKLRSTPKLEFIVDDGYLDTIDELFSKIKNEN